MAKMLQRELKPEEQAMLANLLIMPGWKIVEEMFAEFCTLATTEMLQLSATEERYLDKLQALQVRANLANDVCSSILKSVQAHTNSYLYERELEEAAQQIVSKVSAPKRPNK